MRTDFFQRLVYRYVTILYLWTFVMRTSFYSRFCCHKSHTAVQSYAIIDLMVSVSEFVYELD